MPVADETRPLRPSSVRRTIAFLPTLVALTLSLSCKDMSVRSGEPSWTLDDAYAIAARDANLKSLIVSHNGQIVKERYFHPGDSANAYDVRSVTKSVTGTLVGIAIDMG